MALGSLVWDASATMIDVPLENAINMRSVWTAWFQFWGKQHLLHIDVLFFRNIVNVQAKKALKCNKTSSLHLVCQAAWRTPKIRMHQVFFWQPYYTMIATCGCTEWKMDINFEMKTARLF